MTCALAAGRDGRTPDVSRHGDAHVCFQAASPSANPMPPPAVAPPPPPPPPPSLPSKPVPEPVEPPRAAVEAPAPPAIAPQPSPAPPPAAVKPIPGPDPQAPPPAAADNGRRRQQPAGDESAVAKPQPAPAAASEPVASEGSPLSLLVSMQLAALPGVCFAVCTPIFVCLQCSRFVADLRCAARVCTQNGLGIVLAGGLGLGFLFLKSQDAERTEQAFECVLLLEIWSA